MSGLLSGIRVADFTWAQAGPFCTEILAQMGCEVIKIENKERPDILRNVASALGQRDEKDLDKSMEFNFANLNKKSITLNLSKPEGIDVAKKLIAVSDVVVESFSPGVMKNFGLDYQEVKKIKPDIIMLSICFSGQSGPESKYLGFATIFFAVSGQAYLTGYPGCPPGYIRLPIDCNVGAFAATALTAALCSRRQTGKGRYIDISAREVISSLIGHQFVASSLGKPIDRKGNIDEIMAPHNCYPCKGEEKWISIAVENDDAFKRFCHVLGTPSLAGDARFADRKDRLAARHALDEAIAEQTVRFDVNELTDLLQKEGVAAFPVYRAPDIYDDPHMNERGFFMDIDHPKLGRQKVCAPPWKFSRHAPQVTSPAPLIGEHTDYVLKDLLKISPAEMDVLKSKGVV